MKTANIQNGRGHYCSAKCYWQRNGERLSRTCTVCGRRFQIPPSQLQISGGGKYCSVECQSIGRTVGEYRQCNVCGKTFYVHRYRIEERGDVFCSVACSAQAKKTGEFRTCRVCGEIFWTVPSNNSRCCSLSCAQTAKWEDGVYERAFVSPTLIEVATADALASCGVRFEKEWRPDGYSRVFDFYVPPDLLIEVQGDYWHSRDGMAERDAQKAMWAEANGYRLVEIWEHEISEKGALEIVKQRVVAQEACHAE